MKKSVFATVILSLLVSNLYAAACPSLKEVLVDGKWQVPSGWQLSAWSTGRHMDHAVLITTALEGKKTTGDVVCNYAAFDAKSVQGGQLVLTQYLPLGHGAVVPVSAKNGHWAQKDQVWTCPNLMPSPVPLEWTESYGITDVDLCAFEVS